MYRREDGVYARLIFAGDFSRRLSVLFATCVCLALGACGGGGSHSAPVIPASAALTSVSPTASPIPQADTRKVQTKLFFVLPNQAARTTSATTRSSNRKLQFISPSNAFLSIDVTPVGGSTTTYGPSACTTGSCAVSFTASPGSTTIAFTLTDGSSNVLARFSTLTIIQPSTINTLNFTANPVVDSVSVQLGSSTITAGSPGDVPVTVQARDKANNVIVGNDPYVDANGNELAFNLTTTQNQAGGRGNINLLGPPRVTKPGQAPISAHYDGRWLDNTVISVSPTRAIAGSTTNATLSTTPQIYEYSYITNTGSHTMTAGNPHGIAPSIDGKLWVTEFGNSTSPCLLKVDMLGAINESCYSGTSNAEPHFITRGSDGSMLFTEFNAPRIARLTAAGTFSEYTGMSGTLPLLISPGPDGNLWFVVSSNNRLDRITQNGVISEFTTGLAGMRGSVTGADGSLWINSSSTAIISKFTLNGVRTDYPYTATCASSANDGIVLAPDNAVWAVGCDSQSIVRTPIGGPATRFATGITAAANIRGMTVGPDNNLWFVESSAGKVARMTLSGLVTEYSTGLSGGAGLIAICVGPDGNLWFTEFSTNKIGKLVL